MNKLDSAVNNLYIGLMSGTSLDGVDGVAVILPATGEHSAMRLLASSYVPFSDTLRADVMALQQSGENEIHREAMVANALVERYAACVADLQQQLSGDSMTFTLVADAATELATESVTKSVAVRAIGVHGQTIRHRPELGYTRQTNNPALLAELSGVDVIADFRSRDIAAGGQGAPLVPAFHRAIFGLSGHCRVVANIGGISNISILHADGSTTGFDTGPGNVLMDAWIAQHQAKTYDAHGDWASQGQVHEALLAALCDEDFLRQMPPKSTGRDLFRMEWMNAKLHAFPEVPVVDVQATLCEFTAQTLVDAILTYAPDVRSVYICGGGAYNRYLMQRIAAQLHLRQSSAALATTEDLGVSPHHVEALAFAWLAQQFMLGLPGNLPDVTGAKAQRILGALYPA